ncbi:MAG: LysM domain-containing protein [Dechloromonas sp.]|nr:LysM domain-containing protein [Dechloromonas sp.]
MSIERFPANSRYSGIATAELTTPDGEKIVYLRRRFIPDPATLVPVGEVQVQGGDRLDRLAATNLGDPIQFWRIADGNGAQVPSDLEFPGSTLRLTLPASLGGGNGFNNGGGSA